MGNDGGSIPGRQDLVKKKEVDKKMENDELVKQYNSKYCALSKDSLKKPIVGDRTGLLYNKEGLIKALIEKRLPKTFRHITSLKDVKDLNIHITGVESVDHLKIVCPISMLEYSGINNFFILWQCGCVISKKAIDELNMKDKCIQCGTLIDLKSDLISLNYSIKERQVKFNRLIEEKLHKKKASSFKEKIENEKFLLNNKRINRGTHLDDLKINEISSPKIHDELFQNEGVKKRKIDDLIY